MRPRDVLALGLLVGCGSVSDNGNNIDAAVVVDTTAPAIIHASPAKDATKVAPVSPIAIRFDEALDPATVNGNTVVVSVRNYRSLLELVGELRLDNGGLIRGTVTYDPALHKILFTPTVPLPTSARIDVTFNGVKDLAGNMIAATEHVAFDTAINAQRYEIRMTASAIVNYFDFFATSGRQMQYTGRTAGADGVFFTMDDPFNGRIDISYDAQNRLKDLRSFDVGNDGIYNTADDPIQAMFVVNYNADGSIKELVNSNGLLAAGPDMQWGTSDDVISLLIVATYDAGNYVGFIQYNEDGADNIWRTADDTMSLSTTFIKYTYDAQGNRTREVGVRSGPDARPNTADDLIQRYVDYTNDANGFATLAVTHNAGNDAIWFNADDGTTLVMKTTRDPKGNATETLTYNGPGTDTAWQTADDLVSARTTSTYTNGFIDVETSHNPGADQIWLNADDRVSTFQKHTFDANGLHVQHDTVNTGTDQMPMTGDDVRTASKTYVLQ